MKILFACGGTGGHINPALAMANMIKEYKPESEILFAGNPSGMEAELVPAAGFDFVPIEIKGFMRKLNWFNVQYNISSVRLLAKSGAAAKAILDDFKPDIAVGTGGYVSYPILKKAAEMKIPTVTHESNAFPGLTTKIIAKTATKVLLGTEEARSRLDKKAVCIVTGNPVREQVIFTTKKQARTALGIAPDEVCILSFGGSLGAKRINECIAELMAWEVRGANPRHIHATGSYGTKLFPKLMKERGIDLEDYPNIDVRTYINDMHLCLAAADIVICRSGAMTVAELAAAGKASVLIPSPNVAENHQFYNAKVLEDAGAAVLIEEKNLTGKKLVAVMKDLLADPGRIERMSENARKTAVLDANMRIYKEITDIIPV